MVELTSGLFKSVTIDSNVDPSTGNLGGLTYYNLNLYACITGAIVKYTISSTTYVATTSKTLLSGNYAGFAVFACQQFANIKLFRDRSV
jgi:hypothetical protein